MRVEENSEGMNLFLNSQYFEGVNWNDKLCIEDAVREIFLRVKNNFRIKLKGFYKIKIYPNKAGVFMVVKKIDDDHYDGEEINFRIMVIFNKDLYLKVDDFFYVLEDCEKLFYQDYYYVKLSELESILPVIDFGDVVLDDEINFEKCIYLN